SSRRLQPWAQAPGSSPGLGFRACQLGKAVPKANPGNFESPSHEPLRSLEGVSRRSRVEEPLGTAPQSLNPPNPPGRPGSGILLRLESPDAQPSPRAQRPVSPRAQRPASPRAQRPASPRAQRPTSPREQRPPTPYPLPTQTPHIASPPFDFPIRSL
ncbi:MAG: hypothetical protein ACI9D0_001420, partial [Bacteroidia bacterium]